MDASTLFAVHVSPLELMLRGTLMYWFLLLIFRFVLRRDPGSFGVADILMVVIIADASQNAMSGSYDTVAEGFILVATLVAWNYLLDWAGYHWKLAQKLTEPPPLQLIKDGRVLGRNLRKELLTLDDLKSQLREAGVEDIGSVRTAYLEGDGKLSVLRYEAGQSPRQDPHEGLPGA
ncbi:MAG TPA: YetF domain-containing protein [Roseateles sp.]